MGRFININRYPTANFRGVSAPNADTLYSLALTELQVEGPGYSPNIHPLRLTPCIPLDSLSFTIIPGPIFLMSKSQSPSCTL